MQESPCTPLQVASAHVPAAIAGLVDLAFDLSWTWDRDTQGLFAAIDPDLWRRAPENPWLILKTSSRERLARLAADGDYVARVERVVHARRRGLTAPGWFAGAHPEAAFAEVAYFSAEIGLSECLPFYAGGLGVLAGDHLKSCSALGVPLVAVSLLYGQGFFRQELSPEGWQLERYPVTPIEVLPLVESRRADGTTLTVRVELPGRPVDFLVWQAHLGRVTLMLLDSNLPSNSPADRDITRELYAEGREMRLQQEIALGIGGWRAVLATGHQPQVLHLNEGHAAFSAFERAKSHLVRTGCSYAAARLATAGANIFTTHTPLAAAFDTFAPELLARYFGAWTAEVDLSLDEFLAFGRVRPDDPGEPFNMAAFALRHAGACNGVSRRHGEVSRQLFRPWFPRVPDAEVPVGYVTNGVHVGSWLGPEMSRLVGPPEDAAGRAGGIGRDWEAVRALDDAELWRARQAARATLVAYARERLAQGLGARGAPAAEVREAGRALDPDVLTLGFARRFTDYKRPGLLLRQPERLRRLLQDGRRPLQILMAGKAHPGDTQGKQLLQEIVRFSRDPVLRHSFVFLEDYDLDLMRHLAPGVDVWLNTPRPPLEASGTSGMKLLGNGGLNLSVPDGWWAEGGTPDTGWTIGSGEDRGDAADADDLYALLEQHVVPEFYRRDADGLPRGWLAKVKASMSNLTARFSSDRMVTEYVDRYYVPAWRRAQATATGEAAPALAAWERVLRLGWTHIAFRQVGIERVGDAWRFHASVWMPEVPASYVQAQIFAEGRDGGAPLVLPMRCQEAPPGGDDHCCGDAPADRPAEDYTLRLVPWHPLAVWPMTLPLVLWER